MKMKLRVASTANSKLQKMLDELIYKSYYYVVAGTDMLPDGQVCKFCTPDCYKYCLKSAGNGNYPVVIDKRTWRRELYKKDEKRFMSYLVADIYELLDNANQQGKKLAYRLNVMSDIDYSRIDAGNGRNIFELFPMVQFYDYTADIKKLLKNEYTNYHLTFSRKETKKNHREVKQAIVSGHNVAVIFKKIPDTYMGLPVVNGDIHDLRFIDQSLDRQVIVGLTPKGKLKGKNTNLVVSEVK